MRKASLLIITLAGMAYGCDSVVDSDSGENSASQPPHNPTPCHERPSIAECEDSEIEDNCHWQESWLVEITTSTCGPAEPGPGLCMANDFNDGGCEPGPDTLYRELPDGTFEIAVSEHRCFGAPGFEQCDEADDHPACGCPL